MKCETDLYHIWEDFCREGESTTDLSLRGIYAGRLNRSSGPDFQGAEFELDGKVYRGDVEIHIDLLVKINPILYSSLQQVRIKPSAISTDRLGSDPATSGDISRLFPFFSSHTTHTREIQRSKKCLYI